jgi:hypothetical protein
MQHHDDDPRKFPPSFRFIASLPLPPTPIDGGLVLESCMLVRVVFPPIVAAATLLLTACGAAEPDYEPSFATRQADLGLEWGQEILSASQTTRTAIRGFVGPEARNGCMALRLLVQSGSTNALNPGSSAVK